MSISNQTYKQYSFADHKEVYSLLEKTFKRFGLHYYLIGANARDVQMYKAGVTPNRGTADIDFAVMLPDIATYEEIKTFLKDNGFRDAYGGLPYRLVYEPSDTVLDLLPYGEIAQENTVVFTERNVELSVIGMEEVGSLIENFEHPEGIVIPVSSAHGIVILKLVSWGEKPDRTKDLSDIKAILKMAWELYEEEFFQEGSPYADLFDEENFDMQIASARVMGRKMRTILDKNEQLKEIIVSQIEEELELEVGPISKNMVAGTEDTVSEIKQIFRALINGITD